MMTLSCNAKQATGTGAVIQPQIGVNGSKVAASESNLWNIIFWMLKRPLRFFGWTSGRWFVGRVSATFPRTR
jgi:hypothetical protein